MKAPAIIPSRKIAGTVTGLYAATGSERGRSFRTSAVASLSLGFDGIPGDRHGGTTRRSGGREPWYPQGTEIRNERQLSLVASDELAGVAEDMEIPALLPEWIGANLLLQGIPNLTLVPPRSLLFFEGGATIRIDGLNVPCRFSGRAIAAEHPDRTNLDLAFVRAARRRRGLVGFVEKPGVIAVGETLTLRTAEHWLYE